jgi:hypothetical protein
MGETGRALTFVTPEDEPAWIKLSRQGAPLIRELDTNLLIDEGSWQYREGRPMKSHATGVASRPGSRPGPSRNGSSATSSSRNRRWRR